MKESTKLAREFILEEANKLIDPHAPRLTSKDIQRAVNIVRMHECAITDDVMKAAGFRT